MSLDRGVGFLCSGMSETEMGSVLKQTLKNLCCSNGWSYGVFWRFDQRNPMLLTFEDTYYEEQMGALVNNMILQVHILGEGIIGQTAFTGRHCWMFSDALYGEWKSLGSVASQDIFQDDSELNHQFLSGIKTIVVISVGSRGVVQFGSNKKVLESSEFLDQTKRLLQDMESVDGSIQFENAPSSLGTETYDINELFTSLILSGNSYNGNLSSLLGGSSSGLMGTAGRDGEVMLSSEFDTKIQGLYQCMSSVNNSDTDTASIGAWRNEDSILTSFEPQFLSEVGIQVSPYDFSAEANTLVYSGTQLSVCSEKTSRESAGNVIGNQNSTPGRATDLPSVAEELKQADYMTDISNSYTDDLSQWFAPSPEYSISRMLTAMNDGHAQPLHVSSMSSGLVGSDALVDNQIKRSANSVKCSISGTVGSDRTERSVIIENDDLFAALGQDVGCQQRGDCWEDTLMPVVSGVHSITSTGLSQCKSEVDVGSMAAPRKGLFSELGLEELLDTVSNSSCIRKSGFQDHFSTTKRQKTEGSYSNCDQGQVLASLSCSAGGMSLMQPLCNWDKSSNPVCKKEVLPKSQVGLWIDDSYSINAGKAAGTTPRKPDEPVKATRKRARPGEGTRPRPKDRQQIQDRLKELRGIIPNGGKISIDGLLDLTIKHLLFLQSVTKFADKLKQAGQPKLIDRQNGLPLKDSNGDGSVSDGRGGGATWAFEVGGQTMVCPVIVEDLNPPGHMLIEMLCDERGYFLEIADIIRGFGLNILKGVMEVRENKIWARFIVEANRHVTRLDIFWSLFQLLQQTEASGIDSTNQANNAMDGRIPPLKGCQQPLLPLPISLAETLQ